MALFGDTDKWRQKDTLLPKALAWYRGSFQMWKELRHISKEPLFQTKALGSSVSVCVRLSVSLKNFIIPGCDGRNVVY